MSWFNFRARSKEPEYLPQLGPSGLYLWGDVGCGKTMLMDMLYETLPSTTQKTRVHFHAFMLDMHKYRSLCPGFLTISLPLSLPLPSRFSLVTFSPLSRSTPLFPFPVMFLRFIPRFLQSMLIPDNLTMKNSRIHKQIPSQSLPPA